ncbi:MAG: glycosyltransferase family 39 protein, partial [Chloroflexi bacterium]|nr:glycosyltransferase family 39 protein [Chloroflexota bacterium]
MRQLTSAPVLERRALARRSGRAGRFAPNWALVGVLTAYVGAAFLIPTLANVAITDDWVYYRSVESLLVQHQLRIHELASAALVFQIVWGGVFATLLGLSFGALRISTLVMVGASGLAWYALARELGVSRGRSALGTAAYLFNPLTLALAYTFMTDPHFTALVVIATWLYVRGLRVDAVDGRWLVLGSIAAACAVLVRQQGLLVPAGVLGGLLVAGQLRPTRRSLVLALRVCAIPAIVAIGFMCWLRFWHGVPWA